MKNPFFVVSLPRSRSCWMSVFLSYAGPKHSRTCGHDLLVRCKSIAEFQSVVATVDGTCETAIVEGWKVMKDLWPRSRVIVIKREIADIVRSCRKHGLEPWVQQLIERKEMLDMLAQAPGVKSYWFEDLEAVDACKEIFEFALGLDFDLQWWHDLENKNIQINLPMRIKEIQERHSDLAALRVEVLAEAQKLGRERWLGLQ